MSEITKDILKTTIVGYFFMLAVGWWDKSFVIAFCVCTFVGLPAWGLLLVCAYLHHQYTEYRKKKNSWG